MSSTISQLPYDRACNFSAGPGALPVEVLEQAREEMLNWHGSGVSVMEMSHRGKAYESIHAATIADLRELANIPENCKILFLQGGASLQFTMVPMNLRPEGASADYVVTGAWGKKAVEAAKQRGGQASVVFDAKDTNYDHCPRLDDLKFDPNAAYVHFTSNETIQGVDFLADPKGDQLFVCDMSSNILSRPFDVTKYGLIYAGAQKNMGPAGVTLVIIREDLFDRMASDLPPMLDYRLMHENDSLYNTPPTWSIYICGLVYKHLLKLGGLKAVEERNKEKAKVIYDVIDGSGFYNGHAQLGSRSLMNISFTLPSDDLTTAFLSGAKERRMLELKGHRSVGGCRASVYNAVPIEACRMLAEFMKEFEAKNG